MKLVTIKRGSKGRAVAKWQAFLRGMDLYSGKIDGKFGKRTERATMRFQQDSGLGSIDGVVGGRTWGKALVLGLDGCKTDADDLHRHGPNWPPRREGLDPLGVRGRERVFGSFEFESSPTKRNPEKIKILSRDSKFKVVKVKIPSLSAPQSGLPSQVWFHELAAEQLKSLFVAWDKAGLSQKVISWAGSYVPRFIRGSRSRLSSHAWGSAFDINAAWNGLARTPAYIDEKGSVRELVELAQDHGFFWGGHFRRPDGMHFECVKLL